MGSASRLRQGRPRAERRVRRGSCRVVPRVLPDGRIGKFGWKAQFASLEDFVAAACANEIGLGNPVMDPGQRPIGHDYPERRRRPRPQAVPPPRRLRRHPASPGRDSGRGRPGAGVDRRPKGKALFAKHRLRLVPHPRPRRPGDGVQRLPAPPARRPDQRGRRLLDPGDAAGPSPGSLPAPRGVEDPPLWGVADSAPTSTTAARRPSRPPSSATTATPRPSGSRTSGSQTRRQQAVDLAFLKTLKAPPRPSRPVGLEGRLAGLRPLRSSSEQD